MDWPTLEKEIFALVKTITSKPDVIVGIVRGGIVPARLLARELGVKDMYCLTVKKRGDERHVTTDITDDISGKHVLLVEDMLESGKSLAMAREYLGDKGASVKTACLYTMPATECKPDYSLREVDEVVEFPWE